jgi:hypothetical protein
MVESSRETLYQRRMRYLRRAEEAARRATEAKSTELRNAYLMLSESWLALVQEIDHQMPRR